MLRARAFSAIFTENLDSTASAIFLTTTSGHLIGSSSSASPSTSGSPSASASTLPSPSLIRKAAILGSSTFAHHAEILLSDLSLSLSSSSAVVVGDESNPLGNSTYSVHSGNSDRGPGSSAATSNGHARSSAVTRTGGRGSSGSTDSATGGSSAMVGNAGVNAGTGGNAYLVVQPLPLLARSEWMQDEDDRDGDDEDSSQLVGLRRIVVEIPISKTADNGFNSEGNNQRGAFKTTSRLCAIETIGQGLCIGVLGPEREQQQQTTSSASTRRADTINLTDDSLDTRHDTNNGNGHEYDEQDEGSDTEQGSGSRLRRQTTVDLNREQQRLQQRQIRALSVRTEALAEFMREEFGEFKMPGTVML